MRLMLRPRLRRLAALGVAFAGAATLSLAPGQAQAGAWDYLLPPPRTCGPAETNAWWPATDQAAAAACLVSKVRENYGVRPLVRAGALDIAAYFKASDIGRCPSADPNYWHTACGKLMDYWANRYGWQSVCTSRLWESVYPTYTPYATARHTVLAFLNSDKGHREALLDPRNTHQGMNVVKLANGWLGHSGGQVWVNYYCF